MTLANKVSFFYFLLYSFIVFLNMTLPCFADNNFKFSINRIQTRVIDDSDKWLAISSYNEFENGFFLLGLYQHLFIENELDRDQFDFYTGAPILSLNKNRLVSWVARVQHFSSFETEFSTGLQINLSKVYPTIDFEDERAWIGALIKYSTFIQIYVLKSEKDNTGFIDLNHRFSAPIFNELSLRGFNQYHLFAKERPYFQNFTDLVYAMHKNFNIYTRYTYRSRDHKIFGFEGSEWSFGIRYNYLF